MEANYLQISRTARYYYSGPLDGDYRSVCFALHGYGQLATYFARHFTQIKDVLFIVPEGLHRFYLIGNNGRVGASWMTKEDRLQDIEDYVAYLEQLYDHHRELLQRISHTGILGFSQGVATACRWFANSGYEFNYLINWAGVCPPDLDFEKALQRVRQIPVCMVKGTEDEFINEVQFNEHINLLREKGFSPDVKFFEGGHKIDKETLDELMFDILGPG